MVVRTIPKEFLTEMLCYAVSEISIKYMHLKTIAVLIILLALAACSGNVGSRTEATGSNPAARSHGGEVSSPRTAARELPLPAVPASLTTPEERAQWLAVHFWDALDFADTSLSLDTAYMEQSFANFTTVLALTADSLRTAAVTRLMDRAGAVPAARNFLADIAERYLYDPESPVYNEELYLPFVDYEIAHSGSTPALQELRADIMKNRPGSAAPDFELTYADGHRARLLRNDDAEILLIFYEPDCNVCHDTMARLAADPAVAQSIADGTLRIVAVYQGKELAAWREHAATLPSTWEVTRDASGTVDRRELYLVRATPTIYLIKGNIIRAKDLRL